MEGSVYNQEETSTSRNWEELHNLFSNVIASEKEAPKIRATIKLAKISKNVPEDILARTVPQLLELLNHPPSELGSLVQESSALCLKRIASQCEGRLARLIGQSGGINTLLRLLPNSDDRLKKSLLKCLRNVITYCSSNSVGLANSVGVEIVLNMLDSCSNEMKMILLEIVNAAALSREVRRLIFNSRGVHHLVEAARCGRSISRTRAAQAIGLLGLVKRAISTLLNTNALPVLINLLRNGDSNTKLVSGNALGIIISSHIDHVRLVAELGVVPLYAELLQNPEPIGKEIAEDVFCILAISEDNAITILEHLVRILTSHEAGSKAAAADVIWDLSSYSYSSPVLQNSGVFPVLVNLLKDENLEVREKVAGAIAQLSQDESNRGVLANCGVIPVLADLLMVGESDELRDNVCEALVNFSVDRLLSDRVSYILENPMFQSMRRVVMQMLEYDERVNASMREIAYEQQFAFDPELI